MVVTYYIKLFRTGVDRHNVILMSLLLVVAETIKREFIRYFKKQPPEVFCEKDALKDFANFTEKHLCWSLLKRNSNIAKFSEEHLRTTAENVI